MFTQIRQARRVSEREEQANSDKDTQISFTSPFLYYLPIVTGEMMDK